MSKQTIDQALDLVASDCHIQISGGEPCMVPETIGYLVERLKQVGGCKPVALQTNATLLTPELVRLFKYYEIQLGVSLDGPAQIHDSLRGQVSQTLKGMKLLEEMAVPFRVTTVVSSENILHLDRLALLLSSFPNCMGLGLDLLVCKGRGVDQNPKPANRNEIRQGINILSRTLNFINRTRTPQLRLREQDILACGNRHNFCRAASGESLAVTPDGRLFPCSQSIGCSDLSLGTLSEPDFNHQPLKHIKLTSAHCQSCPLENNCPGDCPNRIYFNNEISPQSCSLYQALADMTSE